MRIEKDNILIRDLTDDDLPIMLKWLTDERVLEFYEGRDTAFTMKTLSEHYKEEPDGGSRVIIEYKGKPIGYGQVYPLKDGMFEEYDYPKSEAAVYAMDQFIGEPDHWDHGIGTAYVRIMTSYLKTEKAADVVLLDPHKSNPRAVRAYEKAGFKIIRELPEHEMFEGKKEDCWLMELKL